MTVAVMSCYVITQPCMSSGISILPHTLTDVFSLHSFLSWLTFVFWHWQEILYILQAGGGAVTCNCTTRQLDRAKPAKEAVSAWITYGTVHFGFCVSSPPLFYMTDNIIITCDHYIIIRHCEGVDRCLSCTLALVTQCLTGDQTVSTKRGSRQEEI